MRSSPADIVLPMPTASALPAWCATLVAPRSQPIIILDRLGVPPAGVPVQARALLQELERAEVRRGVMDLTFIAPSESPLADALAAPYQLLALLCGGLLIAIGSGGHVFHAVSLSDGRIFAFDDEDEPCVLEGAPSVALWVGEAVANGDDGIAKRALEGVSLEWDELPELPALFTPDVLLTRARWVLAAFDLDLWNDVSLADLVAQAPPLAQFEVERDDAETWPHLALYWLWAQFLLDDRERLLPRLEALGRHDWEVIRQSARAISEVLRDGTTTVDLGHVDAAALLAARERASRATPEARVQGWLREQTGPVPAVIYALPSLPPTDALRRAVVDGLERCTRPDVAEMLARASSAWMLHEAHAALASLVHRRAVFWKQADGEETEAAGMICVRSLLRTTTDPVALFDFFATELGRTQEADISPQREQHEACVFIGALLMLDPTHEELLAEARRRLTIETAVIVDGVLDALFDTTNVFALLMPLELQRIPGFADLLQPLTAFDTSDWDAADAMEQRWALVRAQAQRIVAASASA